MESEESLPEEGSLIGDSQSGWPVKTGEQRPSGRVFRALRTHGRQRVCSVCVGGGNTVKGGLEGYQGSVREGFIS
jgi:hypothetical protein